MEPEVLTDYEGMEGTSVYTEESGMLTYEVDIAEEGMYEFGISYYPVAGTAFIMMAVITALVGSVRQFTRIRQRMRISSF